jgi:serine protease Do
MMVDTCHALQPPLEMAEEAEMRRATVLVAPSVVRIETVGGIDAIDGTLTGTGATTGTVVDADGYIITSSFNFISQPTSILVTLADERKFPATIVAQDEQRQLTLLKIELTDLPVATYARKSEIKVGQWAIALGRTYDITQPNVSVGIVSAVGRIWGKAIQTDAKISPANYGGPLIDVQGRIQGILVPLSTDSNQVAAGVEWYDSGIGFAIPMEDVYARLPQLKQGKTLKVGLLGISLPHKGLELKPVIKAIRKGSPAEKSGLKPKDVIVRMDDQPIKEVNQIRRLLASHYAGDEVTLMVKRGDQEQEFKFVLSDKITPPLTAQLGILPERYFIGPGVQIREVAPDGAAQKAGLKKGDVLTKLQDRDIKALSDISKALENVVPDDQVVLAYLRDNKPQTVTLKAERATTKVLPHLASEVMPKSEKVVKLPTLGRNKTEMQAFDKSFMTYVPDDFHPDHSYGLVVFLHPTGDTMEAELLKAWKSSCQHRGLILLAPESQKTTPWDTGDGEFIMSAIEFVKQTYHVDPDRIVLHAYGDSSALAWNLSQKAEGTFAGLILGSMSSRMSFKALEEGTPSQVLFLKPDDPAAAEKVDRHAHEMWEVGYPVDVIASQCPENEYPADAVIEQVGSWVDALDRF